MTESEDHVGYDEDGKKVGICKNLSKWQQNLSQGGAYMQGTDNIIFNVQEQEEKVCFLKCLYCKHGK